MAQLLAATRTAVIGVESGNPRSIHKKSPFIGTAACTDGSHEYRLCDSLTSCSG